MAFEIIEVCYHVIEIGMYTFTDITSYSLQLFMTSQSYPNWTPVTMVTQFGETAGFSSHFPSWPITDLRLSPRKEELNLPLVRVTEVSYPATGQTKVSSLVPSFCTFQDVK